MAGDFNASCLELDNGRWNLYKSRELRYFVERNHLKPILDVDKAPICKCTFTGSKTLFDYIFSDTHMYMSLRSYEILDEGIFWGTSDHLSILAVFNVQSNQHYLTDLTSKSPAWHKIKLNATMYWNMHFTLFVLFFYFQSQDRRGMETVWGQGVVNWGLVEETR